MKEHGKTYVDGQGIPWLVTRVEGDRLWAENYSLQGHRVREFSASGRFDAHGSPHPCDLQEEANTAGGSAHRSNRVPMPSEEHELDGVQFERQRG